MLVVAVLCMLLCFMCGCRATPRAASPAEGTRPAEARQAPRAAFDPQAAAAALEAWRNGPPWNGWEVLREAFGTGDRIDTEALRGPAFDRVLDAFDLEGESFAELKHVLGEPDAEPDEMRWLLDNMGRGGHPGGLAARRHLTPAAPPSRLILRDSLRGRSGAAVVR